MMKRIVIVLTMALAASANAQFDGSVNAWELNKSGLNVKAVSSQEVPEVPLLTAVAPALSELSLLEGGYEMQCNAETTFPVRIVYDQDRESITIEHKEAYNGRKTFFDFYGINAGLRTEKFCVQSEGPFFSHTTCSHITATETKFSEGVLSMTEVQTAYPSGKELNRMAASLSANAEGNLEFRYSYKGIDSRAFTCTLKPRAVIR